MRDGARRGRKRRRTGPPPRAPGALLPISHEIMRNPVMCPDGHSYEKEELEAWLRVKRTSPSPSNPSPPARIFRATTLRQAIEDFGAIE